MEPKQRRILRRLRLELADQLRVEQLVQYLYQERVVSQNFLEELEAEPVSVRRTLKLLDYLPGRGPRAFAAFIESLRDEFPWLCRRLEEEEERAEDEPEPPEACHDHYPLGTAECDATPHPPVAESLRRAEPFCCTYHQLFDHSTYRRETH
ncbi:death domain-containing protein CRADD isoform X2 [Hypanus sabinus]|uniref:death domain-containing protein CRADD isoform X2 n=1 Tax=Hypanus sabinus TaxID=79690 RepID=UPI0028C4755A|nr:death domain-containing protein CRADD isoform X2 [Hypanus sabinus]